MTTSVQGARGTGIRSGGSGDKCAASASVVHPPILALLLLLPALAALPPSAAAPADCSNAGPIAIKPIPDLRVHRGFPVDFRAELEQLCGAIHWEKVEAPPGFEIDGAGGLFYWIPDRVGAGTIKIAATQSIGGDLSQDQRSFNYLVDDNTIVYPPFKEYLSEPTTVSVLGRAHGEDFVSYTVEYAELDHPDRPRIIAGPVTTPAETTSVLAEWDISRLRDGGKYLVTLRVSLSGGGASVVTSPVVIDRSAKPGWPKRIGPLTHSVVMADLDDDARKEALAVTHFGELYAWHIDGSLMFKVGRFGASYSAPSVGDIDGDGRPEIVWSSIYGLYATRADGSMVPGFPVAPPEAHEWRATATLADLDGDGRLDIVIGAQARSIAGRAQVFAYRYGATGTELLPGWPQTLDHFSYYASASVADLDGDTRPEIVAESFDRVYAWHDDGRPVSGLDHATLVSPVTQAQVGSAGSLYSSAQPAIADLNGDGGYEIVIGSNVLRATGLPAPGWTEPKARADDSLSAAIGALDGNLRNGLEIVLGPDVWHANGKRFGGRGRLPEDTGPAVLGDCGEGDLDSMMSSRSHKSSRSGVLGFEKDARSLGAYPKSLFGETGDAGAPVIGDFDGDGIIDLAVGIEDDSYGGVVAIYSMEGPNNDEHHAWPMLGHDIRHSGLFTLPPPNRPGTLAIAGGVLRWEDRSAVEDGYIVEVSPDGAPGTYRALAELRGGSTVYSGAGPGVYRVRAFRRDPSTGQTIVSDPSNPAGE